MQFRKPCCVLVAGLLALAVSVAAHAGEAGPGAGADTSAAMRTDTGAAAKAPAAPAAPAAAAGPTVWDIIEWGGSVGYLIIGISVISTALLIYYFLRLRASVMYPDRVRQQVAVYFREKKLAEARKFVAEEDSVLARIINAGLTRIRGGYGEMEAVMNDVAEDEAMRLEQGVGYFALLAAVGPLWGLLGTIVGMVYAFDEIARKGVVTPSDLAKPIEMALVTTWFGLLVAIPNVVAYQLLRNKLQRLLAGLSIAVEELMSPFKGLKPQAARPATAGAARPADAGAGEAEAAEAQPAEAAPAAEAAPEAAAPAPQATEEKPAEPPAATAAPAVTAASPETEKPKTEDKPAANPPAEGEKPK